MWVRKRGIVKLILNTYNAAEIDGFSYAYVEIDSALANLILKRRDIFLAAHKGEAGENLVNMEYRDYSAEFLNGVPEDTDLPNTNEGGDWDEVSLTAEDLKDYTERTDCDRMVITDDSVYWTAYPHYSDRSLTVETNPINYDTIESLA